MKETIKTWATYFGFVLLSVYTHELGHSIVSWMMGYKSVPTFAKEYALETIPPQAQQYVSLGGILGNVLFVVIAAAFYFKSVFKYKTALFAAAIASPGVYTILFLLKGRGHDSTEFQEAQAALGLNYPGHSADFLFLFVFLAGLVILCVTVKLNSKIVARFLLGSLLTILFMVALQTVNNRIFDRFF